MNRIPVSKPIMDEEMIEAAAAALRDERIVGGESVFKFEEEFARYIGVEHAIAVSSGTDALILALIAADVRNRSVVTTPFTFIASANSIVHADGDVVLADVRPEDGNIDPLEVQHRIDERSKAILPVHIFGSPCDMDAIMETAGKNDLLVVEDACQAHGAMHRGRKVGGIGDIGCFSFYPTKNMTVGGDGGMVTTNDDDIDREVRKYRDCGRAERYLHDVHGFTSRLNTVNAAIGRVQLNKLDSWNESRRRVATRYRQKLKDLEEIVLPVFPDPVREPVFHLFAVQCGPRDELMRFLDEKGIDTAIHYPLPVHLQPAFQSYGFPSYPVSEGLSKRVISLPMHPSLSQEEQDYVCECVQEFFQGRTE